MPRFKCDKEGCPEQGDEVIVAHVKYVWNANLKSLRPSPEITCKGCGGIMNDIPNQEGMNFNFNKFDSLSTQEKRRIMHKRSMDHFNKHDKGDLANYKKKIIDDNKRMVRGELS